MMSNYCHYSDLPSVEAYRKTEVPASITEAEIDCIIEMAWENRTPFDTIKLHFGLNEQKVRELMLKELKSSSYNRWIKRLEK
jgi:uncharacterized protein (TIGR03643 family)